MSKRSFSLLTYGKLVLCSYGFEAVPPVDSISNGAPSDLSGSASAASFRDVPQCDTRVDNPRRDPDVDAYGEPYNFGSASVLESRTERAVRMARMAQMANRSYNRSRDT
jgi:hypothetical protein